MSVTPSVESLPTATPPPRYATGWSAGRIVSIVAGSLLGLASLTFLSFGGLATYETNVDRDSAGFVTADSHVVTTSGYVITSNEFAELAGRAYSGALGDVRLRATATDGSPVFLGVAPATLVDRYLAGVDRTVVTGWFPFDTRQQAARGTAPATAPADQSIWIASTAGTGTQSLVWKPESDTTVVLMHPQATSGVTVRADIGASLPDLAWVAVVLFVVGGVLMVAAVALIAVPLARIRKEATT